MVELKKLAGRLLPSNSTLRFLILSEPDNLSTEAARAKVDVYVKLLYEEIKRGLIKCPLCAGTVVLSEEKVAYCKRCRKPYMRIISDPSGHQVESAEPA